MVSAGKANVSTFTTPAGTNFIRFQTFQSDASAPAHDLDMFVYRKNVGASAFVLIATSGGPDANEVVNTTNANSLNAGAQFRVYIHACSVDAPGGSYTLFTWALPSSASNPFTTVPATTQTVTIGGAVPLPFAWSGLPAGNRYLGRVQYFDAAAPTTQMAATAVAASTR